MDESSTHRHSEAPSASAELRFRYRPTSVVPLAHPEFAGGSVRSCRSGELAQEQEAVEHGYGRLGLGPSLGLTASDEGAGPRDSSIDELRHQHAVRLSPARSG